MPAPHDPDSFIKQQGGPAFQQLIQQAQGFFDYYLDRLCATHDIQSDKGQLSVSRAMAEALQKTGSSVLIDKYAQKTALRLGVTPQATRAEFKRTPIARSERPAEEEAPAEMAQPAARPSAQEFWLLKILLLNEDLAAWVAAHLDVAWLQHPGVREIVSRHFAAHADQTWTGAAGFLTQLDDGPARTMVSEVLAEGRPVPNPQQQLSDLVLRLRNQHLERQIAAVLQQASAPGLDESLRLDLLQQQQQLRVAKTQPLAPLVAPSASDTRPEDESEEAWP